MPFALDKLVDEDSTRSVLDPSRVEKMVFVTYTPPSSIGENRADCDAWIERISYLYDDFHWLLQLPHDKFWCQVIFDETLHTALDSFLRFCPRTHEPLAELPDNIKQRHFDLYRLVFMTYLRMSTHKESKDHYITPSVFGNILYENFLFDIPKIFDICSLYGKGNGPLLMKMMSNIFTQQPKYMDDLRDTIPTILQVLNNIASRCGISIASVSLSPQKLDENVSKVGLSAMDLPQLQDLLLYLSDTALTLQRFLEVYPAACHVFCQQQFCSVLANFYENVIPELTTAVKQHNFPSVSVRKELLVKLHLAKKSLVTVFRLLLNHSCLQPVLENGSNQEQVTACIEEFLHTMTSILSERQFLAAYEGAFSFQDDMDLLLQASSCIEPSQFEYVQNAINSAFATFGRRKSPRGDTNTGGRTSPDGAADATGGGAVGGAAGGSNITSSSKGEWAGTRPKPEAFSEDKDEKAVGATSHPRPAEVEVESLISSVKDLFPHLGEGFIELALEELGWDQELVVAQVLENKLPPALQNLSQDMPRHERRVGQGAGQNELSDLLESRKNVFDNDAFDLLRNKNVDMSKIHSGKKKLNVDLEDKSVVKAVKATYDAYGSVDQESIYESRQMYDDEYDDTYDTNNVGADDADSADELASDKILPRVLQDLERKKAGVDDAEVDEEHDEEFVQKTKRDEFLEDPAKLRQQAEQRRQSQASRRGHGGGGPPRTRDVKGNAKGQGQSSEVQHNRRVKGQFKGQRHRANADKKMSKGMF